MAKKRLAAMLLVIAAVMCACGDSLPKESVGSVTTSTSTSVSVDYAKQYLEVEGPFLERSVAATATLRAAALSRNIPLLIEGIHEVVNATQATRELLGLPKFDSSGIVLTA